MASSYGRNHQSFDAGSLAMQERHDVYYHQANSGSTTPGGYGAGGKYAGAPAASRAPPNVPFYKKPWFKIGAPILLIAIIVGAVVGGVVGSKDDDDSGSSGSSGGGVNGGKNGNPNTDGSGNLLGIAANGGPQTTNFKMMPIYPTTTFKAAPTSPTLASSSDLTCGEDTFKPSNPSLTNIRPDHPRIIATQNKWQCLPKLIKNDPYMTLWNDTIFGNATRFLNNDTTPYLLDGGASGSGILDPAREIQSKMKHWGYAWRMTNDSKWPERAWTELVHAAGNDTNNAWGTAPDRWNTQHFLDVAEMTAAFAYAYDWMYDYWTAERRNAIMWSIINLGLHYGDLAYNGAGYGWWQTTNGNWNCVCNNGLTLGALAIHGDDPTGVSDSILSHSVSNAAANCVNGVTVDGTWSETSDYWFFGSNAHSQLAAAVMSATGGGEFGLLTANPNFSKTGDYHMFVTGFYERFNYGDQGPNKYIATASCMMLYGDYFKIPKYTLFQRDQPDSAEPIGMMYYNPQTTGQWWDGQDLDHHFDNAGGDWAAMRSSWTNPNGIYVAMKAGRLTGHQTHGNLDIGTFVLDAAGTRWFGTLGQNDYLSPGYFSVEAQTSQRWTYYRQMTEGQNTLNVNGANQLVTATATTKFGTSGEKQDSLAYNAPSSSSAFYTIDMSSAYGGGNFNRGIRLINGRRQVLLQDEFTGATGAVEWRGHTNATIALSGDSKTATLTLDGSELDAIIVSPAAATWRIEQPVRSANAPALATGGADLPNPGVSVLSALLGQADTNFQVVFNPKGKNVNSNNYVTPKNVALASWSVTSHN